MSQQSATAMVRRIHDMDPGTLINLITAGEKEQLRKIETTLPLSALHPVTQVRKTFNPRRIHSIAESIAESGLKSRIAISAVTKNGAERYLELLHLLWQAKHKLEEIPTMEIDDVTWYLIFTAGECRTRAFRHLATHPCRRCEADAHERCIHVNLEEIPVIVSFEATPRQIFKDQMIENSHERPDSHAEALAYRAGFELERLREPGLTPHAFATSIGHSTNAVYRALSYTTLPEHIQGHVADGKLGYEKALALAAYHKVRAEEKELYAWVEFAIARPKMPTRTFREHLNIDLENWKSGQLGLFSKAVKQALEKRARKKALDAEFSRDLARIREFIELLIRARKCGDIGRKDSPFSDRAANAAYVEIWDLLETLLPQFLNDCPGKKGRKVARIWTSNKADIEQLRRAIEKLKVTA